VAELVGAADPEVHTTIDKKVVVPLIHKVQLCLNVKLPAHDRCNSTLNAYALAISGWSAQNGMNHILALQDAFFESARDALWLPGR
jgi:hypothetical protein